MTVEIARHEVEPSRASSLRAWADEARAAAGIAASIARTPFVPQSLRWIVGEGDEAREDVDRTIANVTAALLTGQELGLEPMAAMRSMDVINGTPALRALAIRALVLQAGHELWLVESNSTRCIYRGRRRGSTEVQESLWTLDRARDLNLLGKPNWRKQPTAMLVARATAECGRLVGPEALLGMPYAVEELEDQYAEALDAQGVELSPAPPLPRPRTQSRTARRRRPVLPPPAPATDAPTTDETPATPAPVADEPPFDAAPAPPDEPAVEDDPDSDEAVNAEAEEHFAQRINDRTLKALHAAFSELGTTKREDKIKAIAYILGHDRVTSTKDLTVAEATAVLDALAEVKRDRDRD